MPSTREAHSVAMIEALASGAPVIASDIATFRYAESLPGVTLSRNQRCAGHAHRREAVFSQERRYERNLSAYDIRTTERLYRENAWGSGEFGPFRGLRTAKPKKGRDLRDHPLRPAAEPHRGQELGKGKLPA